MEREGAGARRWCREAMMATPEDVIVLSPGPPVRQQKAVAAAAVATSVEAAAALYEEPPEKMFYKTRLCEKYEATGRCMYDDGCTFAHGSAELRPSLSVYEGGWRRVAPPPQPPPPPPPLLQAEGGDLARGSGGVLLRATTKVCFMFRDKGSCHFGEKCTFPHVSAEEIRHPGGPMLYSEPAVRRSAVVQPATRPAFEPAPADESASDPFFQQPPDQEGRRKPTRLEILSRKKMTGIYGDWLEGFPKP